MATKKQINDQNISGGLTEVGNSYYIKVCIKKN